MMGLDGFLVEKASDGGEDKRYSPNTHRDIRDSERSEFLLCVRMSTCSLSPVRMPYVIGRNLREGSESNPIAIFLEIVPRQ